MYLDKTLLPCHILVADVNGYAGLRASLILEGAGEERNTLCGIVHLLFGEQIRYFDAQSLTDGDDLYISYRASPGLDLRYGGAVEIETQRLQPRR